MKNGSFRVSRRVLPVVAILALGGCGLFDDDTQAPRTASEQNLRDRSNAEQANAEDSSTPSLTSVPSRPAAGSDSVRNRVVEGLISDRDNARYTDEAIRLQGSTRPAEASQAASRPPEPAAPSTTTPAPTSSTAQVAVTPPPAPQITSTVIAAPTPPPPAPARVSTPPAVTPRISAPQVASVPSAPAAPRASSPSQSVVVDMSALDGGGYNPVSAQISRDAQVATIQFGHSSSRLDARDQQLIATVVSAHRQSGGNILVVGHASSRTIQLPKSTHEVANFQVSFARANAVAQALIRNGVAPERVTVEAVADDQPIYSESMPTGEAGNRRAEIYFLR